MVTVCAGVLQPCHAAFGKVVGKHKRVIGKVGRRVVCRDLRCRAAFGIHRNRAEGRVLQILQITIAEVAANHKLRKSAHVQVSQRLCNRLLQLTVDIALRLGRRRNDRNVCPCARAEIHVSKVYGQCRCTTVFSPVKIRITVLADLQIEQCSATAKIAHDNTKTGVGRIFIYLDPRLDGTGDLRQRRRSRIVVLRSKAYALVGIAFTEDYQFQRVDIAVCGKSGRSALRDTKADILSAGTLH